MAAPLSPVRTLLAQGIVIPGQEQKPGNPKYTADQQRYLNEKAKSLAQIDAMRQRDLSGALRLGSKILDSDIKGFGEASEPVAETLNVLASLLWQANQMDASITAKKEIVKIKSKLYGEEDWRALKAEWEAAEWRILAGSPASNRANDQQHALILEANKLLTTGRYEDAIAAAQKADAIIREIYEPDDVPPHMVAMRCVGLALNGQRKFEEATAVYQALAPLYADWFGRKSPDYVENLLNLAANAPDDTIKERYFHEAVDLCEQMQGYDRVILARSLNGLATCYQTQQRFAQAQETIARAISVAVEAGQGQSIATMMMRLTEANIDRALGKHTEAEALFKQVIANFDAINHSHLRVSARRELALLYRDMQKFDLAAEQLTAAIGILQKTDGDFDAEYAMLLTHQGILEQVQGNFDKAIPFYEQSLAIYQKTLPPTSAEVINAAINLSNCLRVQVMELNRNKDYVAAGKKLQQAADKLLPILAGQTEGVNLQVALTLQDQVQKLLPDQVKLIVDADAARSLARASAKAGDLVAAEKHLREAIQLYELLGDKQIPLVVADANLELGTNLRAQSKFEESLAPLSAARDAYQVFFEDKPLAIEYPNVCVRLGESFEKVADFTSAVESYNAAMELFRRLGGANNNTATYLLLDVARCHLALGDTARSMAVGRQYVDEIERIFGKQTGEYVYALDRFARSEFFAGKFQQSRDHFNQVIEIQTARKPDSPELLEYRQWLAACDIRLGNVDAAILELDKLLAEARAADNKPSIKFTVEELAKLHRKQGDLATAEKLAEEALALATELQGQDVVALRASWGTLSAVWDDMIVKLESENKYSEAATLREKRLAKTIEYYGADDPEVAAHRQDLADKQKLASLTPDQQQQYRDAQAVLTQTPSETTEAEATKALAAADQIQKLLGENSLAAAYAYRQAARCFPRLSPNAERNYRKSIEICIAAVGEDTATTAGYLARHGQFLLDVDRYQEAIQELNHALEIYNRHPNWIQPATIARTKVDLAQAALELGDLGVTTQYLNEAEPVLAAALNDAANADYHVALLQTRSNVAALTGNVQEKRRLTELAFEHALRAYGEKTVATAVFYSLLAGVQTNPAEYEQARANYDRSMAILKELGKEDSTQYATALLGLARLSVRQGHYPEAILLMEQALKPVASHSGEESQLYGERLLELGRTYLMSGSTDKAAEAITKSLAVAKKSTGENSALTQTCYRAMAEVLHRQGNNVAATEMMEASLNTYERLISTVGGYQTEAQRAAIMSAARQQLGLYVFMTLDQPDLASSAYDHVLWLKGSIFARQRRLRELRSNPAAADLLARWSSVTGALATLAMRPPYAEDQAIWSQRLAVLAADKDAIERQLLGMATQQAAPAVTVEQVRKALPEKSALIDFLAFDLTHLEPGKGIEKTQNLRAFVVRPDRTTIAQINIQDVGKLNDLIAAWRETLDWQNSEEALALEDNDEAMHALFVNAVETQHKVAAEIKQLLWEPLQKELDGVEHVIVSPDGSLAKFPLVALPGAVKNTYLIEDFQISSLAVPSMLPELMAQGKLAEPESLLLLGDVNYGGTAGSIAMRAPEITADSRGWLPFRFSPLDGVLPEMQDIAASFHRVFPKGTEDMFVDSKASEGIFRVEAPKHRWVHLATHGFYEPELSDELEASRLTSQVIPNQDLANVADYTAVLEHEGLKSGLALAGANEINREGEDDGILSAMEVSSMDLSNVELTMLSACQTGLGESLSGEGVAGLQRAFQVAGVRSTVTTLWSVDDTAARLLAARFYRNLWEEKMSKAAAMREAQSWMIAAAFRDDGKHEVPKNLTIDAEVLPARFRLPECWAPFVLSGDWR
jgi:CHAT domain-containing protein